MNHQPRSIAFHQLGSIRRTHLYAHLLLEVPYTTSAADSGQELMLLHVSEVDFSPDWLKTAINAQHQIIFIGKPAFTMEGDLWNQLAPIVLTYDPTCTGRQLKQLVAMHQAYVHTISGSREKTYQTHIRNLEILQDAVVNTVAHEFRTPILQVKSGLIFLEETLREHNIQRSTFAIVQQATTRLEGLIEQLTMLGSSINYHPEPQIAKDLVARALRNLARGWHSQDEVQRVVQEIVAPISPVVADRTGIITVLQMLLDNALRFSDSLVTLRISQQDGIVTFAIEDHGIGIEAAFVERIFDPFYQVDGSTTRRYSGLGVGLTMVKLILDHHQTTLDIHSQPNVGTTVSFRLPALTDQHA